jgi:hypothetical protein
MNSELTVEIHPHYHGMLIDEKAVEKFYRGSQRELMRAFRRAIKDGA